MTGEKRTTIFFSRSRHDMFIYIGLSILDIGLPIARHNDIRDITELPKYIPTFLFPTDMMR